jgi:hypothetical protein
MDKADIAAVLAVGAAFFIAIGDVIHQRSAHQVTDEPVSHVDLFLRLLRDGSGGWAASSPRSGSRCKPRHSGWARCCWGRPLWSRRCCFALPINAHLSHRRVTRWEWTWAAPLAAVAVAVAVIVTVGNPTAGHFRASFETWSAVIAVLGPALMLCVLVVRIWCGPVSAVLLAVVSGTLWGLFAVPPNNPREH